jgi:hypothetical protein
LARLAALCLTLLVALFLWLCASSLSWRIEHDPPLLMYQGLLMDRFGLVPYRDFWDNNPPGTQLFHYFVGRTFGYSDAAVRLVDLGMLAITLAATVRALSILDWRAGVCAAAVWGLAYVSGGPGFQRDDVVLMLASLALAAAVGRWPAARRAFCIGLLLGIAASIKPPAAIVAPPLLAYVAAAAPEAAAARGRLLRIGGLAALGLVLPLLGVLLFLIRHAALAPFLEMARGYWPLYTRLSGGLGTIQSPMFNLYSGYRVFGRLAPWLLPAALGLFTALRVTRGDRERRRVVWLLVALAAAFLLYVGIQGKFFVYHWHPFWYCAIALAALSFLGLRDAGPPLMRVAPAAVVLVFVFGQLQLPRMVGRLARGEPRGAPKGGRVDELASFLKASLRPGDTVQPLDWTGGVVHAMLIAEAEPATPFLYDFPFYHHVKAPYVFELRGRFLQAIRRAQPRFVIEVPGEDKPWVRGIETTRAFNKLRRFLDANYLETARRSGYVIYERRPASS